jgi:hypothetical protein
VVLLRFLLSLRAILLTWSMLKSQQEVDISHSIFTGPRTTQPWTRTKQLSKVAFLALTGIGGSFLVLRYLCVPLLEYTYPGSRTSLLDSGIHGAYPLREYVSTDLTSPEANVVLSDYSCADGLVLLSVGGQSVKDGGPMILDMSGNLVWSAPGQFGDASANTKIQQYHGEDFLTFWAGEKLQESGLGSYYMLNSSYDVVHTVSSVGEGTEGDLHEFKITEDGSALITIYERISVDLNGTYADLTTDQIIVDGVFQEVDVATGKLLFEWRSSDHLEHPALQSSSGGLVSDGSFDYFHMNSIDKDSRGNYLISFRHLHALVYIEGTTETILWSLGNDAGDFEDLSQGDATSFQWQHDARWVSEDEDEGIISLFDNGIAHKHPDAAYSQGLIIQLDFVNWTATLLQEYTSRDLIGSASQGDVQLLRRPHNDDHVFIGWGASAAFTEHSIGGDLLCETHFGASWLFYFERVKSYRAFKFFDWKAVPSAWDPEARIADDKIYVSWNGATEVAYWALQILSEAANTIGEPWGPQDVYESTSPKGNSFEHSFTLSSPVAGTTYRVAALDRHHNVLRHSNEVVYEHHSQKILFGSAFLLGVFIAGLCCLPYSRRSMLRLIWEHHNEETDIFEYHALDSYEPA